MALDPPTDPAARLLRAFDFAEETAAREDAHRDELASLLRSLLDVLDSFDRCLADAPSGGHSSGQDRATLGLIARQLERSLGQAGVTEIPCFGQPFDPDRHDAVMVRRTSEDADGTIVEVVQRGFDWRGRLLRRPRVVVGREENHT